MRIVMLIMVILFAVSPFIDSKVDAIRDDRKMSHWLEALQVFVNVCAGVLAGIILGVLLANVVYLKTLLLVVGLLVLSFILFRFAIFNVSYNKARKLPIHYVGFGRNSSVIDKVLTKLPKKWRLGLYIISGVLAFTCIALIEELILVI